MDDTLRALRAAVRARAPAPLRPVNDHHEARPSRIDAQEVEGAGAKLWPDSAVRSPTPPADKGNAPRQTGAPRAEQISLFGPRVCDRPPATTCSTAQVDPQTAQMMAAYERGIWPEVSAPPQAPPPAGEVHEIGSDTQERQPASTGSSADITGGHRARLRARFDRGETLADYELLELLLFRSLPRRDTKPIAKALIARFGSFAAAVGAPAERLRDLDGVGPAVVTDFRLVRAAAERFALDNLKRRPILSSTDAVVHYYRTKLRTAAREELHVMFVDKKNRLLASECLGVGTVDHAPVYPRELLKRALDLSASAVILVHNHPSGDPAPSRADITMTKKIVEAASALSIIVHDHLIVAEDGYTSLRAERLL